MVFTATRIPIFALSLLASSLAPSGAAAGQRPAEDFIVVPLRIHILSGEVPEIDCNLTDEDVTRIVGKVNRVWGEAGVYFGVESVVREPAARQELFAKWKEQFGGTVPLNLHRALLPEASRKFDGLHIYYVHKLPVNGVYMGQDFAIVQETATLREVAGGIDEPIPRVTSHELGHALGLPHRQDGTNLMASGTTGTLLNEKEIAVARERALAVKGAMKYGECVRRAGSDEKLRPWLDEINRREGSSPADRRAAE